MPDTDARLTDADRLTLRAAMDIIVPPVADLPGAGGLDLADAAENLAIDTSEFRESLHRVLDALSLEPSARAEGGFAALDEEQRVTALKVLETSMPKHFDKFVDLVYMVYYGDERVHERIGWRSGALQPLGWDMPPFDPAILETVAKREPFWRKA